VENQNAQKCHANAVFGPEPYDKWTESFNFLWWENLSLEEKWLY
jgi:hypothetical protein